MRVNKLSPIRAADWNRYLDVIFESILKDEAPIYEPKMNAYLEETVAKYLHPSDDYISLTEIARRFDPENPQLFNSKLAAEPKYSGVLGSMGTKH